jgi:hypothetical protein
MSEVEKKVKELEEIVEQKKKQIFHMNRAIHRLERIIYLALVKNLPVDEIRELEELAERLDC